MAGSTAEVAKAVGEVLVEKGLQVDILPVGEVKGIEGYDGVVVGGPMIMGWHRSAIKFLKKYRTSWKQIPLAVFVTAMSLTQTHEMSVDGMPIYVDERLPKPPKSEGNLNYRERYARLANYLRPILKATHPGKPIDIAIFGGRLEYGRLKWWAVLFAMLIIQAQAGDKRNWTAVRDWAASLGEKLL